MIAITPQEMKRLDHYCIDEIGIESKLLMENAGYFSFQAIQRKISHWTIRSYWIFCGSGNNGGDGFVLARHLVLAGVSVRVVLCSDKAKFSPETAYHFHLLEQAIATHHGKILCLDDFSYKMISPESVCVDAILGIGFQGTLREPLFSLIDQLNNLSALRVALDIPTGLNAETGHVTGNAFQANFTVTMAYHKIGMHLYDGLDICGEIIVADIGIAGWTQENIHEFVDILTPDSALLPTRRRNSHKGNYGKVLLIAGNRSMPGAALLAAKAALKFGAGLVTLAIPESVLPLVAGKIPELMFLPYPDNNTGYLSEQAVTTLQESCTSMDAILLGPGLGRIQSTQKAILQLIQQNADQSLILDADALFALAQQIDLLSSLTRVTLTPHLGEFSRLINQSISNPLRDLQAFCQRYPQATTVLKGPSTLIGASETISLCDLGSPALAKGGSGDVLAGMILARLGNQVSTYSAACQAVVHHAVAARQHDENRLLASEIL